MKGVGDWFVMDSTFNGARNGFGGNSNIQKHINKYLIKRDIKLRELLDEEH